MLRREKPPSRLRRKSPHLGSNLSSSTSGTSSSTCTVIPPTTAHHHQHRRPAVPAGELRKDSRIDHQFWSSIFRKKSIFSIVSAHKALDRQVTGQIHVQIMVYIRTNGLPELSWMFWSKGKREIILAKKHPSSISEKPSSKMLLRPRKCHNCLLRWLFGIKMDQECALNAKSYRMLVVRPLYTYFCSLEGAGYFWRIDWKELIEPRKGTN